MISVDALRRHVIAAQGYSGRRRRATTAGVEAAIERLGAVQLDSISRVDRSHRLTLAARIGAYPKDAITDLLARGRLFEYWAHEACLMPVDRWPMWKRRMEEYYVHPWRGRVIEDNPGLAELVLGEIRERGPLGSRHFEGESSGGMWSWKPAKIMLEALWSTGDLAICGRQGFQRLYDLSERVIPAEYREAPMPSEDEFLRDVALWAVTARGALTDGGIVEHARLKGGLARDPARDRGAGARGPARPPRRLRRRRAGAGAGGHGVRRQPDGDGADLAVRQPAVGSARSRAGSSASTT